MFIKPFSKYNKTSGERYTIYKLCESYRLGGGVHHRTIIGFGRLDELETVEQKKLLAMRVEELVINGGNTLSTCVTDEQVEKLARHFYTVIKQKSRYDIKPGGQEWETVDMSSLKNKDARELGAELLCKQAFDQLGIGSFLQKAGWGEDKISLAATHIISRAVYPVSELKTVSYIKENSAINEITGIEKEKLTKDILYGISHKLHAIIVRTMNTQKCVTTSVLNIKNETISVRRCTEPSKEVKKIYELLNYKYAPFTRKKSVVPLGEILKNDKSDYQYIRDG